jgi:murein DD-endopeptidase MepM/ murein hydrolase activator NlpD
MVEKQVVKEEVVEQPVKQIIAKGPSRTPLYVSTSRGSGSVFRLSWPISGRITSYYGYRWGGFHTGIDIDGVTGQPYTAAAAGKVVSAGWDGNYGYCIIVDHGNGVATRYAHSSKLLVKVGQSVSKAKP